MQRYSGALIRSLYRSALAIAKKLDSSPERRAAAAALHEIVPLQPFATPECPNPEEKSLSAMSAVQITRTIFRKSSTIPQPAVTDEGDGATAATPSTPPRRRPRRDPNEVVHSALLELTQRDPVQSAMSYFAVVPVVVAKGEIELLWSALLSDPKAGRPIDAAIDEINSGGDDDVRTEAKPQCDRDGDGVKPGDFNLVHGMAIVAYTFRLAAIRTSAHLFKPPHVAAASTATSATSSASTSDIVAGNLEERDPILAIGDARSPLSFDRLLRDVQHVVDELVEEVREKLSGAAMSNPWKHRHRIVAVAAEAMMRKFTIEEERDVEHFLIDDVVASGAASPIVFQCFMCEVLKACGLVATVALRSRNAPLIRIRPRPRKASAPPADVAASSGYSSAALKRDGAKGNRRYRHRVERLVSSYIDIFNNFAVMTYAGAMRRAEAEMIIDWSDLGAHDDLHSAAVIKVALQELVLLTYSSMRSPYEEGAAATGAASPEAGSPMAKVLRELMSSGAGDHTQQPHPGMFITEDMLLARGKTTVDNNRANLVRENRTTFFDKFDCLCRFQWALLSRHEHRQWQFDNIEAMLEGRRVSPAEERRLRRTEADRARRSSSQAKRIVNAVNRAANRLDGGEMPMLRKVEPAAILKDLPAATREGRARQRAEQAAATTEGGGENGIKALGDLLGVKVVELPLDELIDRMAHDIGRGIITLAESESGDIGFVAEEESPTRKSSAPNAMMGAAGRGVLQGGPGSVIHDPADINAAAAAQTKGSGRVENDGDDDEDGDDDDDEPIARVFVAPIAVETSSADGLTDADVAALTAKIKADIVAKLSAGKRSATAPTPGDEPSDLSTARRRRIRLINPLDDHRRNARIAKILKADHQRAKKEMEAIINPPEAEAASAAPAAAEKVASPSEVVIVKPPIEPVGAAAQGDRQRQQQQQAKTGRRVKRTPAPAAVSPAPQASTPKKSKKGASEPTGKQKPQRK